MLYNATIINNLEIQCLEDIGKMKDVERLTSIKINKSKIAKDLGVSRKTVYKYYNGFVPSKKRSKPSEFDKYEYKIREILSDPIKKISYIKTVYDYLVRNYKVSKSYSAFRKYINNHNEFKDYFNKKTVKKTSPRYETPKGKQAQLDWKEDIQFIDKFGVEHNLNILSVLLSYSRFRYYGVTFSKTQDVLFHEMTKAFKFFEGVPEEVLVDNMKTIMDISRTKYHPGKINNKAFQYSKDLGFKIKPCIAKTPETKGKVESPMKIFDFINIYQGEVTIEELFKLVEEKNNEENTRYHDSYDKVPIFSYQKEKAHLSPLPQENIQRAYLINEISAKVNYSSMISYKKNQYSVPKKYISKTVQVIVYDEKIHIYYNKKLIAVHMISNNRLNYLPEHYLDILKNSMYNTEEELLNRTEENLRILGGE